MEDIILIGLFAVLLLVLVLKRQSYMSPAPGPAPCTLTPPPAGRTCKTRSKDGSAITIADGLKCPSEYGNLVSAGCGLNYCCQ
jgi:hypothetical protein